LEQKNQEQVYKEQEVLTIMKSKVAYHIVRIILGLAWVLFGVLKFVPMENAPAMPEAAMAFMGAMAATGYFMQFIGLAEIIVGILLLANLAVPFAMMILSALMINIILLLLFLNQAISGLVMVLILLILQIYIMYCTWSSYVPLYHKKKW
jgi:uncharacterized membrane protein YphA (DoxX/SURF4 family)